MKNFIGRQRELELLRQLPTHKSHLVVIKGRRRIGKSRLASEFGRSKLFIPFSGVPPQKNTLAQDQRDEFARQFYSHFKIPPLSFQDWSDAFSHITRHLTNEPTVILLDEISWMGDKDPTFIGKLKNWWDMQLQAFPNLIVILCGSVSTWIEKNIIKSTALFGRISLFLTLNELSLPESYKFLKALNFKGSDYDYFKILSVTGGVPWYLEQIVPDQLADQNIRRLCFTKEGILTHEFNHIFHDLFQKRGPIYKKIVHQLAEGQQTLSELRQNLGYQHGGTLTQYLNDLIAAGFISSHSTWSFKTRQTGKQSLYRLSDNYVRFYLKYIEPNISKINRQSFHGDILELPGGQISMGFQLENLILRNRHQLIKSLGIYSQDIIVDNPYVQKQTGQHRGCQIDYLIQTRTNNLIVCEFKLRHGVIGNQVIDEMKEKIKRLSVPRGFGVIPVLVHLGNISEVVWDSSYFYRIVDICDWLQKDD